MRAARSDPKKMKLKSTNIKRMFTALCQTEKKFEEYLKGLEEPKESDSEESKAEFIRVNNWI